MKKQTINDIQTVIHIFSSKKKYLTTAAFGGPLLMYIMARFSAAKQYTSHLLLDS